MRLFSAPAASSSGGDPLDAGRQQAPRHVSRGGGQSAGGVRLGAVQLRTRGERERERDEGGGGNFIYIYMVQMLAWLAEAPAKEKR